MKKKAVFVFLFCYSLSGISQTPNKIQIDIKDTLRGVSDCILKIKISKANKKFFLFPRDYIVGDDRRNADIMIRLEKLENDKFTYYSCKESPIPLPTTPEELTLQKYRNLIIIDSLNDINCLTRGNYRIQVWFNNRGTHGGIYGPSIESYSNWKEFYVDSNKIITPLFRKKRKISK